MTDIEPKYRVAYVREEYYCEPWKKGLGKGMEWYYIKKRLGAGKPIINLGTVRASGKGSSTRPIWVIEKETKGIICRMQTLTNGNLQIYRQDHGIIIVTLTPKSNIENNDNNYNNEYECGMENMDTPEKIKKMVEKELDIMEACWLAVDARKTFKKMEEEDKKDFTISLFTEINKCKKMRWKM